MALAILNILHSEPKESIIFAKSKRVRKKASKIYAIATVNFNYFILHPIVPNPNSRTYGMVMGFPPMGTDKLDPARKTDMGR